MGLPQCLRSDVDHPVRPSACAAAGSALLRLCASSLCARLGGAAVVGDASGAEELPWSQLVVASGEFG